MCCVLSIGGTSATWNELGTAHDFGTAVPRFTAFVGFKPRDDPAPPARHGYNRITVVAATESVGEFSGVASGRPNTIRRPLVLRHALSGAPPEMRSRLTQSTTFPGGGVVPTAINQSAS